MKKTVRHLAVDILDQVSQSHSFAAQLLDETLDLNELSGAPDGRLLTHLVYGSLRFQGHLDWILAKLFRGDFEKMEESVKNILRVGLYQLKFIDRLPAFAVVDEAVKIAKIICPAQSGLVNAILRNYLRQKNNISFPSLTQNPAEFIAAYHSHPLWLVKSWIKILGIKDTQALCAANNEMPPLTLRVNTLKSSRDELRDKLAAAGFNTAETIFSPDGLNLLEAAEPLHKTNFFREGRLRLQDEASQLISHLVNPQAGESILDLCSGTGGKTTHLAAIMKNSGKIVAIDYDLKKITEMEAETSRLDITIIETKHADLTSGLPEELKDKFDRVLVDAPCSGLGTLRRNPEIKWRTAYSDLAKFAATQRTILQNVSLAVKKGGRLIYTTCSLLPEENEKIIDHFLKNNSRFLLNSNPLQEHRRLFDAQGYFRTYPHINHMDGFFGAVLERKP
jgi:16S rRNA (cytosine967-C5)-methyltransferase